MYYRRVGKSGLKVSEISLGSWLTYGGYVDEQTSINIIRRAYDLGIISFDTANIYKNGKAEEILGKALAIYRRDSFVLSTKVYWPMGNGPNDRGLSRKHIMTQCEDSLRCLQTEYIDIYYCHRFDEETPLEETLRAMDDLVRQRKILYVGVSAWTGDQIQKAVHLADRYLLDRLIVHQPKYNLFNRQIEYDIIPKCQALGISQMVYSPLAQGFLTGKYQKDRLPRAERSSLKTVLTKENKQFVMELQKLACEEQLSLIQLVLAWALRIENISSAIVGASQPEQLEQCVAASGVVLASETIDKIDSLLVK